MIDPVFFLLACMFCGGSVATLLAIDVIRLVGRWRRHRPPVTKGKLDLFDDDGEGHFLSAKLSVAGLEQLLRDVRSGRFG